MNQTLNVQETIERALGKSDDELFADLFAEHAALAKTRDVMEVLRDGSVAGRKKTYLFKFGSSASGKTAWMRLSLLLASAAEKGRRLFQDNRSAISQVLCDNWNACEKLKHMQADDKQLALIVADVFSAASIGLPVATASVLVVKIGVRKFCDCER